MELENSIGEDEYLLKPTRVLKKHKTNKVNELLPDSRNVVPDNYNNRKSVSSKAKANGSRKQTKKALIIQKNMVNFSSIGQEELMEND